MKKLILYLFVFMTIQANLSAQSCGTNTIASIIPLEMEITGTVSEKHVNVFWHVIRTGQGTMQKDVSFFEDLIIGIKTRFASYSIMMGECINIQFIDSDVLYGVQDPSEECLFNDFCTPGGLNVFLIEGDFIAGGAVIGGNQCFIKGTTSEEFISAICHEIGHCFGLFHTDGGRAQSHQLFGGTVAWQCDAQDGVNRGRMHFDNACTGTKFIRNYPFEMADGSNGSTAGDFVADTPADVNLQISVCDVNPYFQCSFDEDSCENLLDDDQRKDPMCNMLSPDWSNYMRGSGIGLGNRQCLDHFTSGQVSRMHGVLVARLGSILLDEGIAVINSDIEITNARSFKRLIIEDGATVTFKDTKILFEEDGKLYIDEGGSLILDNTTLTTCGEKWRGVACHKKANKVELINNSVIEHAEIGIKLAYTAWTDPEYHPTLIMNQSAVRLCDIGIQFGYGKTESKITGGSSIAKCNIGIKHVNHSGLEIEETTIGNCIEGIYSLDGHFTLLDDVLFWGGNFYSMDVGISAEGTLPLAGGLDIGSEENSVTGFVFITEAGIIANGLEHPTGANVTNCAFGLSNGGGVAAAFGGANDFEFVNNSISDIDRGAFIFATGGNPNNVKCNEYNNVEVASNISYFLNERTNFLENHYQGEQAINFALVTSEIPTQGLATNPAANCFSDPSQADHIVNFGFLTAPPTSFLYHYYDDANDVDPCQVPADPQDYIAQSNNVQGDGYCGGNIGIFNLISSGGVGAVIGIDPQHDDPDLVCLSCVEDEIDEWIDNVVNTGGDDPRTAFDESDPIPDPMLPINEAVLHQWISYAIYLGLETGNFAYGEQVLAPLLDWKWQIRLYGLYVLQGNLVRAEQVLNLLSEDNDNQIQFKEVQRINLKRIQQISISSQEIDDIYEIAIGTEPAHGYARSLYRALTGIRLPINFPEISGKNGKRSDKTDELSQRIYPNPTSDNLHVSWGKVIQEITILDITGKIMMQKSINSASVDLDITSFNSGIYIIQIKDDADTITAKKLIKL